MKQMILTALAMLLLQSACDAQQMPYIQHFAPLTASANPAPRHIETYEAECLITYDGAVTPVVQVEVTPQELNPIMIGGVLQNPNQLFIPAAASQSFTPVLGLPELYSMQWYIDTAGTPQVMSCRFEIVETSLTWVPSEQIYIPTTATHHTPLVQINVNDVD